MTPSKVTVMFTEGISDSHESAREFIAENSHSLGKLQKVIAADMDLAPAHLSRKFAQSPGDNSRFTLDDMEKYIETTGDTQVIFYLIEKYLQPKRNENEQLHAEIDRLNGLLKK